MKNKYKILIIIVILISLTFVTGITYSIFNSGSTMVSNDQNIAKFIFNTESLDQLNLSLIDLNPSDTKEYPFSISNNSSFGTSNVTIQYQMTIKTYHLVPLVIELYRVNDTTEEFILTCDENYTRNSQNELICNTPIQEMNHSSLKLDNYKLKVKFADGYNDVTYSDLVDYINIEIKSWQKIEE